MVSYYPRMYRFGFRPWERYGTAAAASIATLSIVRRPSAHAHWAEPLTSAAAVAIHPELSRRGWQAVGIDYVPAAIEDASAGIHRGQLRGRGCHRPAGADNRQVRLLPRHRLLPRPQRQPAVGRGAGCHRLGQPRGHDADACLRTHPDLVLPWRRISRERGSRLRGVGDDRRRGGGHRGPGLADEPDCAAVVPNAPPSVEGRPRKSPRAASSAHRRRLASTVQTTSWRRTVRDASGNQPNAPAIASPGTVGRWHSRSTPPGGEEGH